MKIHIYFSGTYISHPKRISVKSTWAGILSYFVILRFVLSELFRTAPHVKQDITGDSWDEMFGSFRHMVSKLYEEWSEYLGKSIYKRHEVEFFESILQNTASVHNWKVSLLALSQFLARKSGRRVMAFIDEYETPNNFAYKYGYSDKVRFSYYS